METRRPSGDKLQYLKKIWDQETLIQRLWSLLGTQGQTGCLSEKGVWSCKTSPKLKQTEDDRQVGREYPPAELQGTRFPTVVDFFTMLLVEPAESGQSKGSGHWSWGWRALGERRRLHGERRRLYGDWRPWGAGGHNVHLQVIGEKVQRGRRNPTLIKLICLES